MSWIEYEQISTETSAGILTITLDRPERLNAWTARMADELMNAFDRADADDEVRAIIVTGAGRGFCAGADLASGGDTFDYRKHEQRGTRRATTADSSPCASSSARSR